MGTEANNSSDKLIMEVKVSLLQEQISHLKNKYSEVLILPFTGSVDSEIFTGTVLPGAADIQTVNAAGIRHMCAKYMLAGKDSAGNECRIFIENNGYFEPGSQPVSFHACPTIYSDSPVLADYFAKAAFRAEGHPAEGGVTIQIYEVC